MHSKLRISIFFLATIIVGTFAFRAMAFIEPDDFPPSDTTSAPVLTGPQDQTRQGPLTVQGNVSASGPLITRDSEIVTSGDVTVSGGASICLNGDCINAWTAALGDFVRLSPPSSDDGYIHLQGGATFQAATDADFALYSRAIAPTASASYGFYGKSWTGPVTNNYSYGVLGVAAHEGINPGALAYGIFGWNGDNLNAYAGYFTGNVQLVNNSELCLTDGFTIDCRTTWPNGAPGEEFLLLQNTWPTSSQIGNTAVSGNAQFANALLGDPGAGTLTCGDGFCSEDAISCPIDCPTITNIDAEWLTSSSAQFTWTSNTTMTSVVQFGLSDLYGGQDIDGSYVTSHSITIEGLDSDQDYHYRVGGLTENSGAAVFSSDQILSASVVDIDPPPVPSGLVLDVHIPPPSPTEIIDLTWAHDLSDNPVGGSGFKEFHIYRLDWSVGPPFVMIGTTTDLNFIDDSGDLSQTNDYTYSVTAVDNNGNESDPFERAVHIPARCSFDVECGVDPGYPFCCTWNEGDKACSATSCKGGGSPIMLKEDPPPLGPPPCNGPDCYGP
ncbi:MAG: fibronectin type III domain-containing protein [Candidatus Nomurabacteria bacterium]|nr:MAG: fibronectin type III domain-containing protein [Candidatus Nomurabacteria bacterium]